MRSRRQGFVMALFVWLALWPLAARAVAGDGPGAPAVLTEDRRTAWRPGMMAVGGVPARSTVCARIEASKFGDGAVESSAWIQGAINSCPLGQVVQLSAGTFLANNYVIIHRGITLRGAGAGVTILKKTNGARMNTYIALDLQPNIIIGSNRWIKPNSASSQNLASDGAKGSYSVTVANGRRFRAGQTVLLDELSGASWQPDRLGRGQIWASPDYRVVWSLHNPLQPWDDPLAASTPTEGPAAEWFSRQDRVTAEIKEVASVSANTIAFTTPLHIDYRVSHAAQVTAYYEAPVKNAGVENLTVIGGSDSAIRFENAAYSWAKAVEVTLWVGDGVSVNNSFRVEVRELVCP